MAVEDAGWLTDVTAYLMNAKYKVDDYEAVKTAVANWVNDVNNGITSDYESAEAAADYIYAERSYWTWTE